MVMEILETARVQLLLIFTVGLGMAALPSQHAGCRGDAHIVIALVL